MGQVALGFRSLLIKATIFFVMAGLLAWALGGTLFPKPTIVNMSGAGSLHFVASSGGEIHGLKWILMQDQTPIAEGHWQAVVGPVIVDGEVWIATGNAGQWQISKVIDQTLVETNEVPEHVKRTIFP